MPETTAFCHSKQLLRTYSGEKSGLTAFFGTGQSPVFYRQPDSMYRQVPESDCASDSGYSETRTQAIQVSPAGQSIALPCTFVMTSLAPLATTIGCVPILVCLCSCLAMRTVIHREFLSGGGYDGIPYSRRCEGR